MTSCDNIERAPDFLKAFGIALVVFGHVLRGLFSSDIIVEQGVWAAVDSMIYLFHMPLFFYASGLFIAHSVEKYGYGGMIRKVAIVLLIPLAVWSYIQFSLQFLAGGAVNSNVDWLYVLTAPFPPRQQFWFLGVLFLTTAIAGCMLTTNRQKTWLCTLMIALFLVTACFWGMLKHWMAMDLFSFTAVQTIIHLPFLILGVLFGTERMRALRLNNIVCLLIFAGSLCAYQIIPVFEGVIHTIASILCVLCVYKFVLNVADGMERNNGIARAVAFVGMNSMIIYLVHVIAAAGFRVLLMKLGITDGNFHLVGGFLTGFLAPLFLVPIGLKLAVYKPFLARAVLPVRYERI